MLDLGPHSGFIIASYAIALVAVGGLIGWVFLGERRARLTLERLERRGLSRRNSDAQS
jgi:heme exporter protein D